MEPSAYPDRVAVSAEGAAVAALHELPGARMLVFDRELRFILPADGVQPVAVAIGDDPEDCGSLAAAVHIERFSPARNQPVSSTLIAPDPNTPATIKLIKNPRTPHAPRHKQPQPPPTPHPKSSPPPTTLLAIETQTTERLPVCIEATTGIEPV
jgi:hypothetical protein